MKWLLYCLLLLSVVGRVFAQDRLDLNAYSVDGVNISGRDKVTVISRFHCSGVAPYITFRGYDRFTYQSEAVIWQRAIVDGEEKTWVSAEMGDLVGTVYKIGVVSSGTGALAVTANPLQFKWTKVGPGTPQTYTVYQDVYIGPSEYVCHFPYQFVANIRDGSTHNFWLEVDGVRLGSVISVSGTNAGSGSFQKSIPNSGQHSYTWFIDGVPGVSAAIPNDRGLDWYAPVFEVAISIDAPTPTPTPSPSPAPPYSNPTPQPRPSQPPPASATPTPDWRTPRTVVNGGGGPATTKGASVYDDVYNGVVDAGQATVDPGHKEFDLNATADDTFSERGKLDDVQWQADEIVGGAREAGQALGAKIQTFMAQADSLPRELGKVESLSLGTVNILGSSVTINLSFTSPLVVFVRSSILAVMLVVWFVVFATTIKGYL